MSVRPCPADALVVTPRFGSIAARVHVAPTTSGGARFIDKEPTATIVGFTRADSRQDIGRAQELGRRNSDGSKHAFGGEGIPDPANAVRPFGVFPAFEILGKTASEQQEARVNFVSPEYFAILHIPLVEGRLWNQSEVSRGATLVLVNQAFVRRYFSGEDLLNHSVRIPRLTSQPRNRLDAKGSDGWLQVIGVTADALDDGLDKPILPAMYLPYTVNMWMGTQILVRTQGDPLSMLRSVRQAIAAVNPDQQIESQVGDLETWITREPEFAISRLDLHSVCCILVPSSRARWGGPAQRHVL